MATKVTVTGAAGQIGYALLFRIASGQMLGPDTKVHLNLLEIPDAVKAAEGTALELFDAAFPLLAGVDIFDDAKHAQKTGADVSAITNMAIWGNHSPTMYPDLFNAKVNGKRAWDAVGDEAWVADEFIPRVGKRGAEIIEVRGASSAASAASAAVDHVHDWVNGTPADDWTSAGIVSDGSYGVPAGLISSFPVTSKNGRWGIVQGLEIDAFSRARIDASVAELEEERAAVERLGLI